MADNTKIEWTGATWTPVRARAWSIGNDGSGRERVGWHCEHVSEGCRHCYAEHINRRLGTGLDFRPDNLRREPMIGDSPHLEKAEIFLDEKMLTQPLRWRRPRPIFVCSMTDLFGRWVTDEMIDRVFAVMALCPRHTFQVLTKRAERMREYLRDDEVGLRQLRAAAELGLAPPGWREENQDAAHASAHLPLPNVWFGVSAEDQQRFDERVAQLGATPAALRFVSAEPLLGPIDCGNAFDDPPDGSPYGKIDWVIAGGESGPGARPMETAWAESLRDQCAAAGVAFFMKQMAKKAPIPPDLLIRQWPR
jgi:protein gp37